SVFSYNAEGLVESVTYPDGTRAAYSYIKDADGSVLETIVTDADKSSQYDVEGRLTKATFTDGRLIRYDSGILLNITEPDGALYSYKNTPIDNNGTTEYKVELDSIKKGLVTYRIEDNDIASIELADKRIEDFTLDAGGRILNARITYPDSTSVLIENKRLIEMTSPDGVKTAYLYSPDGLSVTVTTDTAAYTYIKDPRTGGFKIQDSSGAYEYDSFWKLDKFTSDLGTFEHLYDDSNAYIGSNLALPDGTIKRYDKDRLLEKAVLPDGRTYEYFKTADFAGFIKKETLPDGAVRDYEYKILPDGTIEMYKASMYEAYTTRFYYYGKDSVSYTSNPHLKVIFSLDSSKPYPFFNSNAYYYSNDKYISLSLSVYSGSAYLSYYSYDYSTRTGAYDNKNLNLPIKSDTDYTAELVWTTTGVDVYLYEASLAARPVNPTYTLSDYQWNPLFSVSTTNASLSLDPSSSGAYARSMSISTDSDKPLQGNYTHAAEFSLYSLAIDKYMGYTMYSSSPTAYNYIALGYNGGSLYLSHSWYDYTTYQYKGKYIPVSLALKYDTTYYVETNVEDGKLTLSLREKDASAETLYTMDNVNWPANISAYVSGGDVSVSASGPLELVGVNPTPDKDKEIPGSAFSSGAPLVFPDGRIDVMTNKRIDTDFALTLPGPMFDSEGRIIPTYDFSDKPYFDVIMYNQNREIKEIAKPNGDTITYHDSLTIDVVSGAETTLYKFEPTDFGGIKNIIVERANVRRVYDPVTGNLVSLQYEGTDLLFQEGSIAFALDGSMLTAPEFNESGIADGVFEKRDTGGNIIGIATYVNGKMSLYKDSAGNEYRYDESGNLIELKKKTEGGDFVTYNYTSNLQTTASLPESEWPNLNPADPTLIKYENIESERRVIYLETKDDHYKSFEYTGDGITVAEGSIEIVDSQKVPVKDVIKKYDGDLHLTSSVDKDGTVNLYEYNPDGALLRIIIIKDGVSYIFEGNILKKSIKDGLETAYYDNGLVKSVETVPGVIKEFKYGVNNNLKVSMGSEDALMLAQHPDLNNKVLLHFNGSDGVNSSSDSSSNPHPVTFYGDVHIETDISKFGGSSLALDGDGDYLTLPDSDDWNFGSGDFTIDLWAYVTAFDYQYTIHQSSGTTNSNRAFALTLSSDREVDLHYFTGGSGGPSTFEFHGEAISSSTWHHMALVRNGAAVKLYIDGKQYGDTGTINTSSIYDSSLDLTMGRLDGTYGSYFNGYIDEFRVSKGVARWTSDFALPAKEHQPYYYDRTGTFTSEVLEVNTPYFQNMSWVEDLPAGTDITFETRSGNTSTPDSSWSDWSASLTDPSGSKILSDGAKYIQFRITLKTSDTTVTPKITFDETNGIDIGYITMRDGEVNKNDVSLIQTTLGSDIGYYTPDRRNIHNSKDMISAFKADETMVEGMINHAGAYLGEGLDLAPGAGINFSETPRIVWTGKVKAEDVDKLEESEAKYIAYETVSEGAVEKRQIRASIAKNGDEKYYYYGETPGLVEDIKDDKGNTYSRKVSTYDSKGVIQRAKLLYNDASRDQTIIYDNGKIDNVTQNGSEILRYTYETLAGGREATVINDLSSTEINGMKKYYVDGQLVKTVDKDGVETSYIYDAKGRILKSTVSRSGKTMEIYDYSYDEEKNRTIIANLAGVKKIYDNTNRLLFVEKDNKLYTYYYSEGETEINNDDVEKIKDYMSDLKTLSSANALLRDTDLSTEFGTVEDTFTYTPGGNFAVEELTRYTDPDGNSITFNEGKIDKITRKDGIVISGITYDEETITGYKIALPEGMGGSKVVIKDNYIYSEEKSDGSVTARYPNGWIKSVKDAQGNETDYVYEVPLTLDGNENGKTYYARILAGALSLDEGAVEGTFTIDPIEVNAKELRHIDW
ncbi:MAG: LamG domain-containing protein, partial [Candidatus Omnitrophota bacterium]|nr:LamG domain-containing protein [Candidatus Omnitrophota bacterium]